MMHSFHDPVNHPQGAEILSTPLGDRTSVQGHLDRLIHFTRYYTFLKADAIPLQEMCEHLCSVIQNYAPFQAMSFYLVDLPDGIVFRNVYTQPKGLQPAFEQEVSKQIESGTFAWALYQNRLVHVPTHCMDGTVVFHAFGSQNNVFGMFAGLLLPDVKSPGSETVPEPYQQLVTLFLCLFANVIEQENIRNGFENSARHLEQLLTERTIELKEAQGKNRQLAHKRDVFFKSLHHQVRTSLTSLYGNLDRLSCEELGDADRREMESEIREDVQRIEQVMDACLASPQEKPDVFPALLQDAELSVSDLLNAWEQNLMSLAHGDSFLLDYAVDLHLPSLILGNPHQVTDIFNDIFRWLHKRGALSVLQCQITPLDVQYGHGFRMTMEGRYRFQRSGSFDVADDASASLEESHDLAELWQQLQEKLERVNGVAFQDHHPKFGFSAWFDFPYREISPVPPSLIELWLPLIYQGTTSLRPNLIVWSRSPQFKTFQVALQDSAIAFSLVEESHQLERLITELPREQLRNAVFVLDIAQGILSKSFPFADQMKRVIHESRGLVVLTENPFIVQEQLDPAWIPQHCAVIEIPCTTRSLLETFHRILQDSSQTFDPKEGAPTPHVDRAEQPTIPASPEGVEGDDPNALRIMLVDDNNMNAKVLSQMLKRLGAEVIVASSGPQAIEKVEQSFSPTMAMAPIDMIFMDYLMPGMDGVETTEKIRELLGRIAPLDEGDITQLPIIALSACLESVVMERCLKAGMNEFLSKPITLEVLRRSIERWVPHKPLK